MTLAFFLKILTDLCFYTCFSAFFAIWTGEMGEFAMRSAAPSNVSSILPSNLERKPIMSPLSHARLLLRCGRARHFVRYGAVRDRSHG